MKIKKCYTPYLLNVLEQSLRMLHPLMPFITEEIWQKAAPLLGIEGDTVMLQPYPAVSADSIDEEADSAIEWVKNVIIAIRNIRGEMNISPAVNINVLLTKGSSSDQQHLEANKQFLVKLAKLESVEWLDSDSEAPSLLCR